MSDNTSSNGIDYTLRGNLYVTGDVTVLGAIRGKLQTAPTAADYAEQFLKEEDEKDAITPGSVVRLTLPSKKLTLNTDDPSAVLMVVSTNPSVGKRVRVVKNERYVPTDQLPVATSGIGSSSASREERPSSINRLTLCSRRSCWSERAASVRRDGGHVCIRRCRSYSREGQSQGRLSAHSHGPK